MIRPGKIIKASTIEDMPEKKLTVMDKVFELLQKKELTTNEMATELKISDRMIRDAVMRIKRTHKVNETKCRCGKTNIYGVKK